MLRQRYHYICFLWNSQLSSSGFSSRYGRFDRKPAWAVLGISRYSKRSRDFRGPCYWRAFLLLQIHMRFWRHCLLGLSDWAASIYDHECTIITQSNEIFFRLFKFRFCVLSLRLAPSCALCWLAEPAKRSVLCDSYEGASIQSPRLYQ